MVGISNGQVFSVHQPGPRWGGVRASGPPAFENTPNTTPNRLGSAPEMLAKPSTEGAKFGQSVCDMGPSKRVCMKPVLYTHARIVPWRLILCSTMAPGTMADPATSVGITNSDKCMRTRTYTVQTPSSAHTATSTTPMSAACACTSRQRMRAPAYARPSSCRPRARRGASSRCAARPGEPLARTAL